MDTVKMDDPSPGIACVNAVEVPQQPGDPTDKVTLEKRKGGKNKVLPCISVGANDCFFTVDGELWVLPREDNVWEGVEAGLETKRSDVLIEKTKRSDVLMAWPCWT